MFVHWKLVFAERIQELRKLKNTPCLWIRIWQFKNLYRTQSTSNSQNNLGKEKNKARDHILSYFKIYYKATRNWNSIIMA